MKTAIYIENGLTQLVLTPETEWEEAVCAKIEIGDVTIKRGSFYRCQGGWVRQYPDDKSLMIILDQKPEA